MEYSITAKALRQASRNIPTESLRHTSKVAILGYRSTQFLSKYLKQAGRIQGIDIEIYEADYRQVEIEIIHPDSQLYAFQADFVWVVNSTEYLQNQFLKASSPRNFWKKALQTFESLSHKLSEQYSAQIIFTNFPEVVEDVFGHFGNKTQASFLNQLRRLNVGLMDLAETHPQIHIFDLANLLHATGIEASFDSTLYINADIPYQLDFEAQIAWKFSSWVLLFKGKVKKCLILDLDNTLWGGVIGDDGLGGIQLGGSGPGKAFSELQLWAKALKERGIILAICSKNTEEIAKEVFEKHEEMVLKLEDIAIFMANWENKADNIRHIQKVLNISFDSMVFLDDNPAERALVKNELPQIRIPDLPKDAASYLPYLRKLHLFDTLSFSELDKGRTQQYQEEAKRKIQEKSFTDMKAYLQSLEMKGKIQPFQDQDISRIAQLSQRSNQFNLRTIRYTESEIKRIQKNNNYSDFQISLEDRFGKYGLISVLILRAEKDDQLFIETWLMSCRVLKRGVEKFVLNQVVAQARSIGYQKIIGEYLPTAKNTIVANHYEELGFKAIGEGRWELTFSSYQDLDHFIKTY
ncbi:MAG: HAD-IIIC family phosphatase [Bacteroidota bacterium]